MRSAGAVLAVVALSATACGLVGGGKSADDYARQACKTYDPSADGHTAQTSDEVDQGTRDANKAANLAAKAARMSIRWNALSEGMSSVADVWTATADAQKDSIAGMATYQENQTLRAHASQGEKAASAIRAECRKALA